MKTLLITGATGVLGKNFISRYSEDFKIVEAMRNPNKPSDIRLNSWNLEDPQSEIDAVIHFAGKYLVDESIDAIKTVHDSVVGTASAIADFCGRTSTPLIAVGSYFEAAPIDLQPWSYYASAKKTAFDLLTLAANRNSFPLSYVYCYDTYGEDVSRRKIIDILLDPNTENLELSEGLQKMNLTNLNDFGSGIRQLIENFALDSSGIKLFQIKNSQDEFTLQEIANKVNSLRRKKIDLVFGAKPYRNKEVFSVWNCAPLIPNWEPAITFESFLEDYLVSHDV